MARDKRLTMSVVLCMLGLLFALSASGLISVTILRSLWTSWGRSETSRIVNSAIECLFQTEEQMLVELGLDPNCTSYLVNRTGTNHTRHILKRWDCTTGGTTLPPYPTTADNSYRYPTQGPRQGTFRRKRQISDFDHSCSTQLFLTRPIDIPARGRGVPVKPVEFAWTQPPRYQFLQEGECQAPGLCGFSGGRCVLHPRIQPVLVSAKPIQSKYELIYAFYENKVWFEPYEFRGSCKCRGTIKHWA